MALVVLGAMGSVGSTARGDQAEEPPNPTAGEAVLPSAGGAAAVQRAEASLGEYVFDEALAHAEQALQAGGLSRELFGRALKVRAESLSALNRPEDAERAYAAVLSVRPDFDIDARLGPRIRSPFFEARAFLDAQPHRPGLTLSIREDRPGRVDVQVHDPLTLVAKVVVHHRARGTRAFSAVELPARGGVLPLPDTSPREVYIQALTPEGSVAFELGGPAKPMSTEGSTTVMSNPPARPVERVGPRRRGPLSGPTRSDDGDSIFESPVFWVIAGVVVTGAAATGIVIATQ